MIFQIETRTKRGWVSIKKFFVTAEQARQWGRWNYRDDEGLGKENWNWRIVEVKRPSARAQRE